jgi:putative flippase GtrA
VLRRLTHSRLARVFTRFAAGSAVASVCSQLAFLLLFGMLGASAAIAGAVSFLAGAVPNFVIQRYWTWQRSGRVGVRRELAPYAAVVALNGALATGITAGVDHLVGASIQDHAVRTAVLSATLFASFVLLFVLKFALLDRVFRNPAAARYGDDADSGSGSAAEPGRASPAATRSA